MTVITDKDSLKAYFGSNAPVTESEMIDVFDSFKNKSDDEEIVVINSYAPITGDKPLIIQADKNITLTYFLPIYEDGGGGPQLIYKLVKNSGGTLTDLVAAATTTYGDIDTSTSFASATFAVTSVSQNDYVFIECTNVGVSSPMTFVLRYKDA